MKNDWITIRWKILKCTSAVSGCDLKLGPDVPDVSCDASDWTH